MITDWNYQQVELSRATLEFSFTSPNDISGLGTELFVVKSNIWSKKTWVQHNFVQKKLSPSTLFPFIMAVAMDHPVG